MEVRLHGRGGQGGVTCAKLLAALYAHLGKCVQAFGDYAGERSGAPIRAYLRVADRAITDRNKVYQPDHLLVLDPTLLEPATVAGLKPGGLLLVNTPESPQRVAERFPGFRVATLDATAIAKQHGIGSRSLVIVNTALGGAFAHAMGLPESALEAAYRELGVESDLPAARQAWLAVQMAGFRPGHGPEGNGAVGAASPWGQTAAGPVRDLVEHREGPAPLLQTGSWRTQLPHYLKRLAPCVAACPAGNDVVGFVQALARHGEQEASEVLGLTNPLAGVCGRVCPAFCMQACNRRDYDGSVDVRALERWISDHVPVARRGRPRPLRERRVAILGGGPAGLSAAYTLARLGHRAVIFEAEQQLGGVLHTGIPTYRLPRQALEREIAGILQLGGVEVRTGQRLTGADLAGLLDRFDAVIVATGLQRLTGLEAPGSHLARQGVEFLHRVNVEKSERLSGHVVVLGGGNTAMDCARSAVRLGADRVTVAYRRTLDEMPALPEEVEEAREEGVVFLFQRAPLGLEGEATVRAIRLAEVEMGPPDPDGRRRPVVTDRVHRLECDHVLLALGQSPDPSILPPGWTLVEGTVLAEGRPLPVVAAGDFSTRDGTVTHAVGDGRRAATRALFALGEPVTVTERPSAALAVGVKEVGWHHFDRVPPGLREREAPAVRSGHFGEVCRGLRDGCEAGRCLSCGDCTRCDVCMVYCPDGIIRRTENGYEVDLAFCKGCGLCVAECPRGALEMVLP